MPAIVAILGAGAAHSVSDFHRVWAAEAVAGLVAALAVAASGKARSRAA